MAKAGNVIFDTYSSVNKPLLPLKSLYSVLFFSNYMAVFPRSTGVVHALFLIIHIPFHQLVRTEPASRTARNTLPGSAKKCHKFSGFRETVKYL